MKSKVQTVSSKHIIPYQSNLFNTRSPNWNYLFLGQSEHKSKIISGMIKTTQHSTGRRLNLLMVTPYYSPEMEQLSIISGGISLNLQKHYQVALLKYPLSESIFRDDYLLEVFRKIVSLYPGISIAVLKRQYEDFNPFCGAPSIKESIEKEYPLVTLHLGYENTLPNVKYISLLSLVFKGMINTNEIDSKVLLNFYNTNPVLTLSSFYEFAKTNALPSYEKLNKFLKDGDFPFFDSELNAPELDLAFKNGVVYVHNLINTRNMKYGFYNDFVLQLLLFNQDAAHGGKILWYEMNSFESNEFMVVVDQLRTARFNTKSVIIVPHRRLENLTHEYLNALLANITQTFFFKFVPEAWNNIPSDLLDLVHQTIPNYKQTLGTTLGDKFIKSTKEDFPLDIKFLILGYRDNLS